MMPNPSREVCEHAVPMNYDCSKCIPQSNDKSFIIVLDRMKEQKLKAVKASDPTVESPVIDGYKQGHYDCILEVIQAFKVYG